MSFYTHFWNWLVPWTGEHVLHLSYPITVKPNGSGDTTYNYVLQLLWIVFAFSIAIIWLVLDRKRPSYHQFQYWVRILVRYFLAFSLFVYGFVKVIKLQFPEPSLYRLLEPYGDSTPMGLAWTFIGLSKGYNIYIGGAEVLAGALLFFRRTTLFGALVAMTVMANVVAMNMAYDIPVKLFSFNLFVMALWIAWFDMERLINFFFLNKATAPSQVIIAHPQKWKRIVQLSLKTLAIGFALYATLWSCLQASKAYGDAAPKPPMFGIYEVSSFQKNGQILPPLTTDTLRWKRLVVNYPGRIGLFTMTDSLVRMKFDLDTLSKTMVFTTVTDSTDKFVFSYKHPDRNSLLLNGNHGKDSLQVLFKKVDLKKFKLTNTGFHWINEYPNNR
ncbi:MAG: hypothetical protein REI78_11985 [Pedobacter sp.]|nr:hypothetical protein [Pedobacter sp.]MDQ8053743.1 hypothetical protein [Pedobacter sp.]